MHQSRKLLACREAAPWVLRNGPPEEKSIFTLRMNQEPEDQHTGPMPNQVMVFYFATKMFATKFIPKFRRAIMVSNIL